MSYMIKCSSFFSMENDERYSVLWPEGLSESSRRCIENVLFRHNKQILGYGMNKDLRQVYNDNSFLLIFEEGGAVFNLRTEENNTLCTCIEGLFIPWMYIPTAWLMIDKLLAYVKNNTFDEYFEMKSLYEDELEEYLNERGVECVLPFDPAHNDIPFSFAISLGEPEVPEVRFFPCKSLEAVLPGENRKVNGSSDGLVTCLEVLDSESTVYDEDFVIERLHPGKLFMRNDPNDKRIGLSNWAMKYVGTYPMTKRIEALKFLNSGKAVRFSRITEIMDDMKKYG